MLQNPAKTSTQNANSQYSAVETPRVVKLLICIGFDSLNNTIHKIKPLQLEYKTLFAFNNSDAELASLYDTLVNGEYPLGVRGEVDREADLIDSIIRSDDTALPTDVLKECQEFVSSGYGDRVVLAYVDQVEDAVVTISKSLNVQNAKYKLIDLETSQSNTASLIQTAGAKKRSSMKRTVEKVKIGKAERVVYLGMRGGKYVKMNGEFVALSKLSKK